MNPSAMSYRFASPSEGFGWQRARVGYIVLLLPALEDNAISWNQVMAEIGFVVFSMQIKSNEPRFLVEYTPPIGTGC